MSIINVTETTTRPVRRRFSFATQSRKQIVTTPLSVLETTTEPALPISSTKIPKVNDQTIGFSAVQAQNQFSNHRYNQIGELLEPDEKILEAIKHISKAPLPFTIPFSPTESISRTTHYITTTPETPTSQISTNTNPSIKYYENVNNDNYNFYPFYDQTHQQSTILTTPQPARTINYTPSIAYSTFHSPSSTTPRYTNVLRPDISTTVRPRKESMARYRKPEPFEKIEAESYSYRSGQNNSKKNKSARLNGGSTGRTYRPVADYDYYDDGDTQHVGKLNSQVNNERVLFEKNSFNDNPIITPISHNQKSSHQIKVVLHGPGVIECLDQGNFPHPLSCRKFISCAKMETGGVVGWEYTCPRNLSYDPVGGICNWSAGLGCKE